MYELPCSVIDWREFSICTIWKLPDIAWIPALKFKSYWGDVTILNPDWWKAIKAILSTLCSDMLGRGGHLHAIFIFFDAIWRSCKTWIKCYTDTRNALHSTFAGKGFEFPPCLLFFPLGRCIWGYFALATTTLSVLVTNAMLRHFCTISRNNWRRTREWSL